MGAMFLPFKRYADFSGRSARKEYWLFTLFLMIVTIVVLIAGGVLGIAAASQGASEDAALGVTALIIGPIPGMLVLIFEDGPGCARTPDLKPSARCER